MEVLSNNEKLLILEASEKGMRIDGRGLFDYRRLSINFMRLGQVEVALGNSLVLCSVDASITPPFADRPNEGFLNFNVNFLPMAHPGFENLLGSSLTNKSRRQRNDISQEIERVLEKSIKKSRALNTESLCIVSHLHCWNISVNLHILAHHGNLIDLSVQACTLALLHARVPDVKINSDKSIEILKVLKPLSLHFVPISVTFGFFKGGVVVLDPEIKEEAVLEGKLVVCMNIYGDILALQKSGGAALKEELVYQCLDLALIKTQEITKQVREAAKSGEGGDVEMESAEGRADRLLMEIR